MAHSSSLLPLPQSVEQLLQSLCTKLDQVADVNARRELAAVGEEAALLVLQKIGAVKGCINNLSAYIARMTKPSHCSLTPSPQKKLCFGLGVTGDRSPSSSARRVLLYPTADASSYPSVSNGSNLQSTRKFSPQLEALGKLEFRKAFLILNYLGDRKLEDTITADDIRRWENLSMHQFELKVWGALGNGLGTNYIKEEDRARYLEWDSGKTHLYHCHVSPDGSFRFKGPHLDKTRTHLQRVLGDENVLLVKFEDAASDRSDLVDKTGNRNTLYSMIAKEGIVVALRHYRFFVFKDGGKERKKSLTSSSIKCYFVRMESDATYDANRDYILHGKTVPEARRLFMHAHTVSSVAKYMARFSLILSKTIESGVDLASVHIQTIEDINCEDEVGSAILGKDGKPLIHTDGTGFISQDLALECAKRLYRVSVGNKRLEKIPDLGAIVECISAMKQPDTYSGEPPLLVQCRLFNNGLAVKGTVLVNKKLPHRTIQVRPSMIKVEIDPELSNTRTVNSLEINGTSNQPKRAYLSKNLIALLSYGGVPDKFFLDILKTTLQDANGAFSNKRAALRVSVKYGEMDGFNVARMILSGMPLNETYMHYHLAKLLKEEMKSLKGGKLHVPDCHYLMGTTDPTGILKSGQVCIILENGQIQGQVLVYRNPGLHFGDIHVLEATYVKALESVIGNAKYAIFFPCKGKRSLGDEMAGGDFDGDMYWVSKNPQLLQYYVPSEPWKSESSIPDVQSKRPSEFSAEELEDELFKLFLTTRFQPSYTVGVAADSWLALMDRLLTLGDDCAEEKDRVRQNILQLIDIYYDALDAPKKGIKIDVPKELRPERFPHYMGRENSFNSSSILGLIYDTVDSYELEDFSMGVTKLPGFDVNPPECFITKWKDLYNLYRQEMSVALRSGDSKDECAGEVIKKYKNKLYDGDELRESKKDREVIFKEAIAIYHVCYDYARNQGSAKYCHFAWKVAGSALCEFYATKQSEYPLFCIPSLLKELFG